MRIVNTAPEMHRSADAARRNGKRIAVVPTMGALHEGHLSLIRLARQRAGLVVTTIFVNPTQFEPAEDLERYPRDVERDAELSASAGTDILFVPSIPEMYPPNYLTFVTVEKLTTVLEGKFRPNHFRGVTTVVAKLLSITKPHLVVFGQKDAQQAVVIGRMVEDLNFDVEVIVAPTIREPDGLAMSSRNAYLSADERRQSLALSQSLRLAEECIGRGERTSAEIVSRMTTLIGAQPSARIDYVSIADPSTLEEIPVLASGQAALISLAVHIGKTRLIDNTIVNVS